MTVAAAAAKGFATAVKGAFGWTAICPTCRWSSPVRTTPYKGDAAAQASDHNAKHHAEAKRAAAVLLADTIADDAEDAADERYGLNCWRGMRLQAVA